MGAIKVSLIFIVGVVCGLAVYEFGARKYFSQQTLGWTMSAELSQVQKFIIDHKHNDKWSYCADYAQAKINVELMKDKIEKYGKEWGLGGLLLTTIYAAGPVIRDFSMIKEEGLRHDCKNT